MKKGASKMKLSRVKKRRKLVAQIKEFGRKEFGLPWTRNFSRYFSNKSWCFFVMWCASDKVCEKDEEIDEKLFFDKEKAIKFCQQKTQEKFDAFIFKVPGFIDENLEKKSGSPLTSLHLNMAPIDLVSVIFHEDFHIWARRSRLANIMSDTKTEESLANAFADIAAILWLKSKGKPVGYQYELSKRRIKEAVMTCRVYDLLRAVYKRNDLNIKQKETQKRKIFKRYKKIIFQNGWSYKNQSNFASLYTGYVYSKHAKLFHDFFISFGINAGEINLKAALKCIKIIAQKSKSPADFVYNVKKFTGKNRKSFKK